MASTYICNIGCGQRFTPLVNSSFHVTHPHKLGSRKIICPRCVAGINRLRAAFGLKTWTPT
jgi:hypothetical protein